MAQKAGSPPLTTLADENGTPYSSSNPAPAGNPPALTDGTQKTQVVNGTNTMGVDSTGAIPVQSGGTTGAAVPARAIQVGGSDGTNLRSLKTTTDGTLYTANDNTGTPTHSADATVDATAGGVTLLAAAAGRKSALIQNTGTANCRVTWDGAAPTATNGFQLAPGQSVRLTPPEGTLAVKAIREGTVSTTCSATAVA